MRSHRSVIASSAPRPVITGVTLSNSNFSTGATTGTAVGTLSATMSRGTFSGTFALSDGTNLLTNPTQTGAVAGTPGTLPTGWSYGGTGTLTTSIIGTGTSGGLNYIDIRVNGTTSTTLFSITFDSASVSANTQYTLSSWVAITANVNPGNIQSYQYGVDCYNGASYLSSPAFGVNPTLVGITSFLAKQPGCSIATPATTTLAQCYFALQFLSGVAIDITLRIAGTQFGLKASSNFAISGSSLNLFENLLDGSYPITVIATQANVTGSPLTQNLIVSNVTSLTYGTVAPASLPNTTGAVSPLGWVVRYFDDFKGAIANTQYGSGGIQGQGVCTTGAMYPLGGATLATYDFFYHWGDGGVADSLGGSSSQHTSDLWGPNFQINSSGNGIGRFLGTNTNNNPYPATRDAVSCIIGNMNDERWGYWECNCKFAAGANGVDNFFWSGWWLTTSNQRTPFNNWPQEVDMFEQWQGSTNVVAAIHYDVGDSHVSTSYTPGVSLSAGFHTYGCLVCPNYVAMYYDGTLYWVQYRTGVGSPSFTGIDGVTGSGPSAINNTQYKIGYDTMYPIFGLYLDRVWDGSAVTAQLPTEFQIDWIRFSRLSAS